MKINIFFLLFWVSTIGHLIAEPEIMSKDLQAKIYQGDEKALRAFLDKNKENIRARNYFWQTPLIILSSNGKMNVIRTFVEIYKPNLEDRDRDGNTALIAAAQYGWTEVVEYLLGKGASKYATNSQGETASDAAQNELAIASGGPFTEVVNMLSKAK